MTVPSEQRGYASNTYKNHLRFGYGPELERQRSLSFFNIKIADAQQPMAFHPECLRAAKLIAEQAADLKILLPLSGGLDSEVVARSFLLAGIQFEAVILNYLPDLNSHDTHHAYEFCKQHNIRVHSVDLDVIDFFKTTSYLDDCELYKCNSPMFSVFLEICRRFKDYFLVFSGVTPVLMLPPDIHNNAHRLSRFNVIKGSIEQFQLFEFPVENIFCFEHFFSRHQSKGVSSFYLYTPELIMSSLLLADPILQYQEIEHFSRQDPIQNYDMVQHYHSIKVGSNLKYRFFKRAGFDVSQRISKFTGFEWIHAAHSDLPSDTSAYKRQIDGMTHFNKLYRAPMEEKLPKMRMAIFDIDTKNRLWLLENALDLWSKDNIAVI